MNILIVDDHPPNRKLLRVTLEAEGFTTLEAADGLEALAVLEQQPVEAIISDILMPRMDGFRLCQELRKDERLRHLPFIICSATCTSPGDEKLALDCGADRYLRKPCPTATMVAALQEAAAQAKSRGHRHPSPPRTLEVMREHNEALVKKLEERNAQLDRVVAELRESEERFRTVANFTYDWEYWRSPDGRFLFNSASCERLTGYPAEDFLRDPELYLRIVHPEDRERLRAHFREDVTHSNPCQLEFRLVRRDGEVRWISHACQPVLDAQGRLTGRRGSNGDITERRAAEEELRQSADGLRAANAALGDSRRAALNLMDDALAARQQAEKAGAALQRSTERFKLLSDVAGRLLAAEDPQALVNELCRAVMRHLDCQVFFNFIAVPSDKGQVASGRGEVASGEGQVASEGAPLATGHRPLATSSGCLRLNAYAGITPAQARALEWLDYGVDVCGCAAQGRCRIAAQDIQHTSDPRTELVKSFGLQAHACHPLMAGERLLGTLSFGTSRRTHFTEDELALMKTVADQVAVAMDRVQTEQALRRAKEEWEKTFDSVPDLVAVIDRQHRILRANRAMAERLGLTPSQCLGHACHRCVHGKDKPPEFCPHAQTLVDGREHMVEVSESCLGGDFLVSTTPLFDERNELIGSVHVARDITALKHAQAALQQSAAELARSNQELEQFAYVASHDLQEPLRAVAGYVSMIGERFGDRLDDKERRYIDGAVQGAARMNALITDLLALSRVGSRARTFEATDLEAVLEEALSSLSASLRETGARVTHDPLPTVPADARQLAQLFQNLIGNALKFRSERPPEVHVSAQPQADGWLFGVRDNGIGIEPQYFERIFLIFQRLHSRAQYPGTGIGLAICRKIVQRHGGAIWVESQPGHGSTFLFTLPNQSPTDS